MTAFIIDFNLDISREVIEDLRTSLQLSDAQNLALQVCLVFCFILV